MGSFAYFVIFSEVVFVVTNLYFLGSVVRRLQREGFSHFLGGFWNLVDVTSLLLSFSAIGVYVTRTTVVYFAMKKIKRLRGES